MRVRATRWIFWINAKSRATFSPVNADVISTGAYLRKKILERVSSIASLADCFSPRLGLTKSHLFKIMMAGFRAF
jgi:hypothetical protein